MSFLPATLLLYQSHKESSFQQTGFVVLEPRDKKTKDPFHMV